MKKITLLLLAILYSFVGYSQFPENFESTTVAGGFPTGWLVTDNGVGTSVSWAITDVPSVVINGTKSAYINRQNIGMGNTSEDWLISPATLIPTNGQLRFLTQQTLPGNQQTLYQIRIYSGASQSALSSYTVLKQWTEFELNAVHNVVEEKVVDFPTASIGTNTFIAFVRVYTQPTAGVDGDRWLVDDINVVQKCLTPSNLSANTIAATTANLFWPAVTGATGYDLEILTSSTPATGTPTNSSVGPTFPAENLSPNTNYKYYVRTNCGGGNFSEWVGPFNFTTLAIGTACSDPILISSLPYQTVDNTGNFGNLLAGPQVASCISGSVNYQSGNDVFYSYTATASCPVSFTLNSAQTRSSMFIYASCAGLTGPCLGAAGDATNATRVINLAVTEGVTYIIVISSNVQSPTVGYNLLIQCENCPSKPTDLLVANTTLNGADFSWTAPTGTVTSYQVAVQSQGSTVPSGAGQYIGITGTTFTPTDLDPATPYQYWVRSECSPGVFSAWSGPILFNTQICAPADKCDYTFRMTDSANNGWNGALMQVRQNGIIVATIGSTYTFQQGAGPVDVIVPLCTNVPFDIFWSVPGTQPQQCIVTVINKFGQTIAKVIGADETVGTSIYNNVVNCTAPLCNIAPINVTVTSITTTGGTINWEAPGTEGVGFDIYIVPTGQGAPDENSTPTFSGTNGTAAPFSFNIPVPNTLIPDTSYDVYVRVECSAPADSPWSVVKTFKTLPTCPKPTNQTVTGITTTSAVLGWTPGASETKWDVLLLAAPNGVAPAAPGIAPTAGPNDILIEGITGLPSVAQTLPQTLASATIYYYYVRAVCQPGDDASTWTGPFIFNTITCNPTEKCFYKFVLTNPVNNNWNLARMQVRQNGIVVATLGVGGINNANGIPVSICDNVPFDLYWSVAGDVPENVGIYIIDANNDIVYTKEAGQGAPLTVLYEDLILGNCQPPSCPKPTNLLVTSVSQTSVTASWTETGSAPQWEVYAVVEGGTPPVNGSPLNTGVAGYSIATTNVDFPITNLLPGTKYQYYVRAICSATDISNWTLLTPKSFITRPANDECSAAINVPVNPTQVCSQIVSGNTLGGTASIEVSTCPGIENDDVWFSFVATNNIHIVNLQNIVGSTTSLRFAVYEGGDCSTFNQIFCSATGNNNAVLLNLTAGTIYKIRVYTNGSIVTQSASFDICVSTPPAPATNDECVDAIDVVVNTLSECAYVTPGNLIGATGSTGVSNTCVGTEDDDVWFKFVATSGNHIISLLNVEGTTTNLNHAVYSGTCSNLVQLYCSAAGSLNSNNLNYVIGNTYYLRVWSNGSNSEVVTFNVCIKPVSSCQNAAPFCGGSVDNPYIFPNTTNLPNSTQVACLFSIPNPTYYTLHVGQTGPINFTMYQNTNISTTGQLLGNNLDVDFVAWGPFTSTDACDEIVFGPCPGGCGNNTSNPNFYPLGNIVDCSYDAAVTETISIPNAQAGEFYIILITNYSNQAGFIKLIQTNFDVPGAGDTLCCGVDLGEDIVACADSVTLNALEGVIDLNNVPVVFEWYFNNVLIAGETQSTITVTQSGTYTVKGNCGLNPVEDSIEVTLSPAINVTSPLPYEICDTAPFDGFEGFDLNILTPQVLGTLVATDYNVSYYILEADAIADANTAIDLTTLFINTIAYNQTIYIRVESNAVSTCFSVVPVDLIVGGSSSTKFEYSSDFFCKNELPNPLPIYIGGGAVGAFTFTPAGLVINPTTGEIDLATSVAGSYTITNTMVNAGPCGDAVYSVIVVIDEPANADFSYAQAEYCLDNVTTVPPIFTGTATAGTFTSTPAGLVLDAVTGVITLQGSTEGTYVVTNTIDAVNACTADDNSFTITLIKAAAATIGYDDPFCASNSTAEPVTLTGTTGGTFSSTTGLTIDANTGTINPSASSPGAYVVTYTTPNVTICGSFSTTANVTIGKELEIDFTQGCNNNAYQLVAVPFNGSFDISTSSFLWTGPSVTATPEGNTIILGANGDYTVTVTNAEGCSATETITVNNISCTIQKGISPNNDGDNDSFDLSALNVKELFIYNRYGTEVYSFGTYTNQWKGQSSGGKELPDGTYFYVIHTAAGENITGWIQINR